MVRDDAWFEGLYERHHGAVAAYCARRIGPSDAPDAVADVFAVAWRRRDDVPGEQALPWLYGVARRVVSHQWRGARRRRRLVERAGSMRVVAQPGPDVAVIAGAEHQLVRDAVMQLRPMDREVLMLSAWEGLRHDEIADALGCSRAAIDKRITRAKTRLARRYESLTDPARPRPQTNEERDPPVRVNQGGEDT